VHILTTRRCEQITDAALLYPGSLRSTQHRNYHCDPPLVRVAKRGCHEEYMESTFYDPTTFPKNDRLLHKYRLTRSSTLEVLSDRETEKQQSFPEDFQGFYEIISCEDIHAVVSGCFYDARL
jgi:hypothetical protein